MILKYKLRVPSLNSLQLGPYLKAVSEMYRKPLEENLPSAETQGAS